MGKLKSSSDSPGMMPAITPEGQESRCISLALNLAEERLRNRTASSQEVTHFLKRGSEKEQLEMEKLAEENKLLRAKTAALESQKQSEAFYQEVLTAMKTYAGASMYEDEYDENY